MDNYEACEIINTIDSLYPNRNNTKSVEEIKLQFKYWISILLTSEYEKTKNKLLEYSKNNKYPPSISDIYSPINMINQKTYEEEYFERYANCIKSGVKFSFI